ncbi:hypothetical protein NQ317_000438 [Molorchus minor]|uniref:Coiled-coil domain-containing protein 40 n=1 Tax=Molorchus minor TaxID=1323400 RepID=A0ABQ9J5W3_9CUCU|nr:hypothetical protein NQ317_000438 [Molorchus minor]
MEPESSRTGSEDSVEVIQKCALNPDHPLLQKFQQSLKEHLLFQIERTRNDIFEYETEAKKKNVEREELGVQTYEAQQMVCKQQNVIENLFVELQNVSAAKEEMDNILEERKRNYKEVKEEYYSTERSNRELQGEIEAVNFLIRQLNEWENNIESNISVNQRIAEKTKKDNLQLSEEKRIQDLIIHKLTTEIWKLEGELETMQMQIKVKSAEMEDLEQAIALGNTNIDALQAEYRCLMHSWNSVVVTITNRTKTLDCLNSEIHKLQEEMKLVTAETEQVRKLTRQEMNENESRTLRIIQKNAIEGAMFNLQSIIDETEKDIVDVQNENRQKQALFDEIAKDLEKISNKKVELEEKVLKDLQNQMAANKAAASLYRILNGIKDKKREVEILMNEAENKSSQISAQIESQKYSNDENNRLLQDILKQQADLGNEADSLQNEKAKYELLFRKRERQVDIINSKLEKAMVKADQPIVCKQEAKIQELEKHIEVIQASTKQAQTIWLRGQKNLLVVSKERQEQIFSINLLKKQTLILEQKNLRIRDEIEAYKKAQEKVLHNVNNLQNRSVILCENLFRKRNQKTHLDRNNILLQTEYDSKLKDAELACLQMQADIVEVEEDKVNLSKEIIEVNREVLEWEKKLQHAKETMTRMKEERSEGGEVGSMKLEIHRMNVIYGQMKRAQDKLIKDLEHCISRRDSIYLLSEARQKKVNKNVLITEIFAFKSIAYLKADPGQYLTYLPITRSILAKVRGNRQARLPVTRSVHVVAPPYAETEEEVLDIVEDDPSTSTREIARQYHVFILQDVADKVRVNYTRKLDNVRNKIKQIENEIEATKNKCQALEIEKEDTLRNTAEAETDIKTYEDYVTNLNRDLEVAKTNRELNYQLLLVQQKKLNMYNDLSMGRTPYTVYKKEEQLVSEYDKQKDLNNRLCHIVDNLSMDCPQYGHKLDRLHNSLRICTISMYT